MFWTLFWYIGFLRGLYLLLEYLYFTYLCKISLDRYKYGWILITGASDGIGKALATHLAKKNFNLLLLSKTASKLESLTKSLKSSTNNSNIHYIPTDFSTSHQSPEQFYSTLMSKLQNYEISAVFNNVGVCEYRFFADQRLETIENMLSVNLYPMTMLTYYLLPVFLKRFEENKKRSLIVNLSSTIDLLQVPTTAMYTATKTYIDYFSEGVRKEYKNCVDVATVKPGVVATKMSSVDEGNGLELLPLTVNTDDYAKYLIEHLHTGVNYGHWKHYILVFVMKLLPYQITNFLLLKLLPVFEKLGLVKH